MKQRKAIYMERPKAPNYSQSKPGSTKQDESQMTIAKKTGTKSGMKRRAMTINKRSRSPSPFDRSKATVAPPPNHELNERSNEGLMNPCAGTEISERDETPKVMNKKELKKLLKTTKLIDQIFDKRTKQIQAQRQVEEEKKAKERADADEINRANTDLRDSLCGRLESATALLNKSRSINKTCTSESIAKTSSTLIDTSL